MQTHTRLDARSSDFEQRFRALLAAKREVSQDVDDAAAAIIADVRARGDAALFDLTRALRPRRPPRPRAARDARTRSPPPAPPCRSAPTAR